MTITRKNSLSYITLNAYALERQYGVSISLKKITSSSFDVETGEQTRETETKEITRAVVLPVNTRKAAFYKMITSQFKHGGLLDIESQIIIIRKAQLGDFTIDKDNTFVITEADTFKISDKVDTDDNRTVLLEVKTVTKAEGVI